MREAHPGERRAARRARNIAAERPGPEGEVFASGQRALQRVGVAEVVRLLADRPLAVAAVEGEAAGLERELDEAQDRGLVVLRAGCMQKVS